MNAEFSKTGPNFATSNKGFTVRWHPHGGVDYADDSGTIRVDSELLVKPLRILIYRESKSIRAMPESRANEILENIQRALEYLGHPNEISQPY
jgi:hypothetical protein